MLMCMTSLLFGTLRVQQGKSLLWIWRRCRLGQQKQSLNPYYFVAQERNFDVLFRMVNR